MDSDGLLEETGLNSVVVTLDFYMDDHRSDEKMLAIAKLEKILGYVGGKYEVDPDNVEVISMDKNRVPIDGGYACTATLGYSKDARYGVGDEHITFGGNR